MQSLLNGATTKWAYYLQQHWATAVIVFVAIYRSKGCVDGFYDDWGCATCEDGKWYPAPCLPDYKRYHKLIESCKSRDNTMPGCFNDSYHREFSIECQQNPTAALCDGKYDHKEWVKKVYDYMNMINNPPPKNV